MTIKKLRELKLRLSQKIDSVFNAPVHNTLNFQRDILSAFNMIKMLEEYEKNTIALERNFSKSNQKNIL